MDRQEVMEAIRSQLQVNPLYAQEYRKEVMDVELANAEEVKKIQHCDVIIRGVKHRIGPAFPYNWRVETVLMVNAYPKRFKETMDAFCAALRPGATFLAATHGSTMYNVPDFRKRVHLLLGPGVHICDVVPRVIEVDSGRTVEIVWYGAPTICTGCRKLATYRACPRNARRLWRPPTGRDQRTNGGRRNGNPTAYSYSIGRTRPTGHDRTKKQIGKRTAQIRRSFHHQKTGEESPNQTTSKGRAWRHSAAIHLDRSG